MIWWRDVLRQCVFLCFFIIPIPIGAYTIHSGSSAVVAIVSYVFLSLVMPLAYVGCQDADFGSSHGRIRRWILALVWLVVFAGIGLFTAYMGRYWKMAPFWQWPTVARDLVLIPAMYLEVTLTMLAAYVLSQLAGEKGRNAK